MSHFPLYSYIQNQIEDKLRLFNYYAAKSDLKSATGVDTSQLANKDDLANLKLEVDKLDIDESAEWDADNLKPVSVDLKKISDAVDKNAVKNMHKMI